MAVLTDTRKVGVRAAWLGDSSADWWAIESAVPLASLMGVTTVDKTVMMLVELTVGERAEWLACTKVGMWE